MIDGAEHLLRLQEVQVPLEQYVRLWCDVWLTGANSDKVTQKKKEDSFLETVFILFLSVTDKTETCNSTATFNLFNFTVVFFNF